MHCRIRLDIVQTTGHKKFYGLPKNAILFQWRTYRGNNLNNITYHNNIASEKNLVITMRTKSSALIHFVPRSDVNMRAMVHCRVFY